MQNLMAQVTTLMQEKDDVIRKLQRVEVSCDHYQKSLDEAQKSAESLQKTIVCCTFQKPKQSFLEETDRVQDCARFVLVLIDGDVTLVCSTLILSSPITVGTKWKLVYRRLCYRWR